jgi:hypothetical protein
MGGLDSMMASYQCWIVLGFFGLFSLTPLWSNSFPVEVRVASDMDKDSAAADKGSMGEGREKVATPKFTAVLKNTSTTDFQKTTLRVYIIGQNNAWESKDEVGYVFKVFVKEGIAIPFGVDVSSELGEVEFKSFQSKTESVRWRGGFVYAGYVAELYDQDVLIGQATYGGKVVLKAHKDFLNKKKK